MQPLPLSLYDWIDKLIDDEGWHPISVAGTVRQIRAEFPDLSVANDDLAKCIAARAVRYGCGVEFDEVEFSAGTAAARGAGNDPRNEPEPPTCHGR